MVKNPSVNAGDAGSIPGLGRPPGESESEVAQSLSVRLLATPWTAASQAPLSMGFSRQEHWSGLLPGREMQIKKRGGITHPGQSRHH